MLSVIVARYKPSEWDRAWRGLPVMAIGSCVTTFLSRLRPKLMRGRICVQESRVQVDL